MRLPDTGLLISELVAAMDIKLLPSIFESMEYSKSEVVDKEYQDWCQQESSTFVDISELVDEISKYLEVARSATTKGPWNDPVNRATLLFKLAQAVEKKKEIFACVESESAQKPINRTRGRDIPELIQHLYAAAHQVASCPIGWPPRGVVGVFVDVTNSPSLCQTWNLGPALAAGNSVVLCVSPENCKTAILLSNTAKEIGFPEGILRATCIKSNLIVDSFDMILESSISPSIGSCHREHKWQPIARPKAIVTDTADIAAAVHGVIQLIGFNSPMSSQSGACVLVQENIYNSFWEELSNSFKILRGASSVFDRTGDYYFKGNKELNREELINTAKVVGAELCFPTTSDDTLCCPVLVHGIDPTSTLLGKTASCAQIVWLQSFRHYKEAVTLANGAPFTAYVSIWGEQTSIVLEMARELRPHTVWINTQNVVDIAGSYDIYDFLSAPQLKQDNSSSDVSKCKEQVKCDGSKLALEFKKGVSQARAASKKWADMGADSRAKILFSLAGRIKAMDSSFPSEDCTQWANLLYKYASQAAIPSFGSGSQNISGAKCWTWVSAVGVVGVSLPQSGTFPVLVSALGAALAAGNTLVALVPDLSLTMKFTEMLASSGLPSGVANLVFSSNHLQPLLTPDIDAAWLLTSCVHPERPQCNTDPHLLTVSSLNLSEYNWQENSSDEVLRDWFQRQAITIKKVWFESGHSS